MRQPIKTAKIRGRKERRENTKANMIKARE